MAVEPKLAERCLNGRAEIRVEAQQAFSLAKRFRGSQGAVHSVESAVIAWGTRTSKRPGC